MENPRRQFLRKTLAGAGLVGPMSLAVSKGAMASIPQQTTVVYVFLRGGIDGLSLLPPVSGPDRPRYEALRPNIQVPTTGDNRALPIGNNFGLHAAASELRRIYNAGKLAVIHSTGLPTNGMSRSHFDASEYIELGTPGDSSTATGWLARHLNTAPGVTDSLIIPSLAAGSSQPTSLLGDFRGMTVDEANSFHPNAGRYEDSHIDALERMYGFGASELELGASAALNSVNILADLDLDDYEPAGGAQYENNSFARQLSLIANVMGLDLGLRAATIDFGGWDNHNGLGDFGGGAFNTRVAALTNALGAFWTDVNARGLANRLLVVVHSEFGRRARENGDRGVDHGSGNPMFVYGGRVNGGHYGGFAGLDADDLFDGQDVRATTDFRRVLATVVREGAGNYNLDQVFPGYTGHVPMPFLAALPPDDLFASGFE